MHETLPASYPESLEILMKVVPGVKGFEALAFPDYVQLYGTQDWERSLPALGYFTKFGSAEFAIRPFLAHDFQAVMPYLNEWAADRDENVRRLVSEGTRPRLPWGIKLEVFIQDPTPMLPLLEQLKEDPSETVRRSVANHLNDISKDNPEITLEVAERWYGESTQTDAIVKHACRGLLKAGDRRAMRLFGFGDPQHITINDLKFKPDAARIGEKIELSFELNVNALEETLIRLEYVVDYVKAKGKRSRKVFQISEKCYSPGAHRIHKRHSFEDMSTRKHYPGAHKISIIVNGVAKGSEWIELS
jgi:3-methyladenine DNA glycosylase AlkC